MPFLARLNNAQELAKKLTRIQKFTIPTTTPTVDTLSAAVAADDTTVTVTTFASWATGDDIIINGSGGVELNRLGTKPGSSAPIPVVRPLTLVQASGAAISKAEKVDLGYIEDAGGTFATSSSKTGIGAANAGGAIAYIDGDTPEQQFSFSVRESSLQNILGAYGIDETTIRGAGTDADPYRALVSSDNIGSQSNFCLRASGLLVSGKTLYFDLWNCFPEVNISAQFVGKGQPTTWGMSVKYTKMLAWVRAVALT